MTEKSDRKELERRLEASPTDGESPLARMAPASFVFEPRTTETFGRFPT